MNRKMHSRISTGALSVRLLVTACAALSTVMAVPRITHSATEYMMWYEQPGTKWKSHYLPVGNSLFGAGLMGGVAVDSMFLNDNAAFEDNKYRGLAWMKIAVEGTDGYTAYRRDLDLGEAVAHVSYTAGGKEFTREYFCSLPDTVMVYRYACSAPGAVSLTVGITPHATISSPAVSAAGNALTYTGSLPVASFSDWNFSTRTVVRNHGGSLAVVGDTSLQVTGADSVDIYFTSSHNLKLDYAAGFRSTADPESVSIRRIDAAMARSVADVKADHIADFQSIFNRFTLDLDAAINTGVPTDQRIADTYPGTFNDPGLEVLWLQFYRYVMICASRAQLPTGLLSMWGVDPASYCGGNYYMDQNFQMNYWGCQALNVQETMLPVISTWLANMDNATLSRQGELALKGNSGPYDTFRGYNGTWMAWMMCNLYEHYRFDPDPAILQQLWPLLKGNAAFFLNRMTHDLGGRKSLLNGQSPENNYLCDPVSDAFLRDGSGARITFHDTSAAFGQQCALDLLTHTVEAAEVLDIEPDFKLSCQTLLAEMDSGLWISPTDGRLQEFWHDSLVGQRYHRHCSHLLSVWPFDQVTPLATPEYAAAAEIATIHRGINFGTSKNKSQWLFNPVGFGEAIRAGLWARLGDGDSAHYAYHATLAGWVAPNFWPGAYYPGEQPLLEALGGAAASVAEMLVQSHVNYTIQLLPALPSAWPKGSVQGLRCRNGFTITGMSWDNGELVTASIRSDRGNTCRIYGTDYIIQDGAGGAVAASENDGCMEFGTTTGLTYRILPKTTGMHGTPPAVIKSSLDIIENQLRFSTRNAEAYTIRIADLQGQPLLQRTVQGPATAVIPLDLTSGFHMISVTSEYERIEKKVVRVGNTAF